VLLPGFGGGDQTLLILAAWLRRIGYRPHTAGSSPTSTVQTERSTRLSAGFERSMAAISGGSL
jgi:hypothetical protein